MALDLCNFLNELKPAMVMVVVQIILAGLTIFYMLATRDGMNLQILVAYRSIVAMVFLAPLAFFFERNKRPKLTWMVTFQAFLCGFFGGTLGQNLYVASLNLTSMTFTVAMFNLIPAMTYILAVIFRLERVGLGTLAGKAKIVGTIICIGGVFVLTFYKGAEVNIWSTNVDLTRGLKSGAFTSASQGEFGNRILGSLLALGCSLSYALWLSIQAKMNQRYPCYLSSTVLMLLMGTIQSVIYALCVERNWEEWKLGWNIRLWTVAYTGILAAGLLFPLIAWGVKARGPLFVSLFYPLMLVLVAIMGSLLLDEKLHIGIIIGGALIVVGLYVVLWGKGKEMKKMSHLMVSTGFKEADHIKVVVPTINSSFSLASAAITDISNDNNLNVDFENNALQNLTKAQDLCNFLNELKPTMVMVVNQIILAWLTILYMLATRDGMNMQILVAYRSIIATFFLAPFAFFFEGLNVFYKLATKDGMKLRILVAYRYIFATIVLAPLAFFIERGTLCQNLYLESLTRTSATFAIAMLNLTPAITYVMATILRLERLGLGTIAGNTKLVGTCIGVGGAMVLTFYKGAEVNIWKTNVDLTHHLGNKTSMSASQASHMEFGERLLGAAFAIGCCFFFALWLIIQSKLSVRYPCSLSATALVCVTGSIQSTIYAVCMERKKWEEWKLGWNIRLLTVTYAGILATGVYFSLVTWGVKARGPLFVSIFTPVGLVLVAIMSSLFLGEKLHVGSIIGAAIIVMGLYTVLWGKAKEMKKMMPQLIMLSKTTKEAEVVNIDVVVEDIQSSSPTVVDTSPNNILNGREAR
ncbi:hypothetical protein NE237_019323 [Protea cynaroides]|uniref:EamA domain-containing protein n=1 Tax=Protea cynaroides TaxID=273540 RepID=A0A9Q0KBN8_9MAGN|nr:hypothetical protein NE237_019323 [Protea cynaroides]